MPLGNPHKFVGFFALAIKGGFVDDPKFKVAFLDTESDVIDIVSIPAATVASAAQRAEVIAKEIDAAEFFITSVPLIQDRTPPFYAGTA